MKNRFISNCTFHKFPWEITDRFTGKGRPDEITRNNTDRITGYKRIYKFVNGNFMND